MAELMVVATPIGNLSDLSGRMVQALTDCDLIAAEDTRVTMKLLNHLGIKKPTTACHRHNERQKAAGLIEQMLRDDLTVCFTCDAGTPGISDPGNLLVEEALSAGIRVTPICGPTAITAHLSACGFDAREFAFYGFLPRERKPLREKLTRVHESGIPIAVFYESPHRVVKLIEGIAEQFAACRVSVACDISKRYEKILTGPVGEVLAQMRANPMVEKGEYSVVLDVSMLDAPAPAQQLPVEAVMIMNVLDGGTLVEAAQQALDAGYARNLVYKARLRLRTLLDE